MGFPKAGVWIVSEGSADKSDPSHWSGYWIMRLGDQPTVSTAAAFHQHRHAIGGAVREAMARSHRSPDDVAKAIIDAAIKAVEDQEAGND